jgi:uncharacterized protein (TIGR03118 family)
MAFVAAAGLAAAANPAVASTAPANSFVRTVLVANTTGHHASLVDPNLQNAWGLAAGPNQPIWVSDNNSSQATVYSGGVSGSAVTQDLKVPVPGGNPTGQVFNPTQDFGVGGTTTPAIFIVDTDSIGSTQSPGQIEAWDGGKKFVPETTPTGGPGGKTPAGAVFKALAIAATPKAGPELFAADVANGTVDVFNSKFQSISTPTEFQDPALPKHYVPFGIQNLNNKIYVSYGRQNAAKNNVVPGTGFGVVDVYSVDGVLLKHLVSNGASSPLNEPWGLAIAPAGFGPFAGDLLVGNLGNGWINAFNPTTGAFLGTLDGSNGYPITIPGLWGLMVGNTNFGGSSSLVFSAGPAGYANGLLGILNPAG